MQMHFLALFYFLSLSRSQVGVPIMYKIVLTAQSVA